MAPDLPLLAVAPEFGVRVKHKIYGVKMQAFDSGGRGHPYGIIVVPVDTRKDKHGFLGIVEKQHEPVIDFDWVALKRAGAYHWFNKRKKASPYPFAVPRGAGPFGAPKVLVLLLYIQDDNIGGFPPTDPLPAPVPSDLPDHYYNEVAEAVRRVLIACSIDELRGGLVENPDFAYSGSGRDRSVESKKLTFAVASCQYPGDIFDTMPVGSHATPGPPDAALLALGNLLDKADAPTLLLLAGDQIYTDATAGLFDPKVLDDKFRIPHQRRGQGRGAKALQSLKLRIEMILDDHEIRDNWAPNDPEPEKLGSGKTFMERGKSAYFENERLMRANSTRVWHRFTHEGYPFFLGDTRTERGPRDARIWRTAEIMSRNQFKELCDWMMTHASEPKFVLTPSALLPRRTATAEDPANALHSDAWDGYPLSLHQLLKFVYDNDVKGLVFLSGDEHRSSFVTAHLTRLDQTKRCTLRSIHSSPLYAPYPFANSVLNNFLAKDTFLFPDPKAGPYCCDAIAEFAQEGDGFALVTVQPAGSGWSVDLNFHDADGPKTEEPIQFSLP